MLVGQPAEETLVGAQAMLDDGRFTRFPKPDFALAEHCDASLAAGKVGIRAGCTLANSDTVMRGRVGDSCHLQATVHSYSDNVREMLLRGIERKAQAIAAGAKAPEPTVTVGTGTPALENDARLTGRIEDVFRRVFGSDRVVPAEQSMGAEDFSRYGRVGVPVLMFRLGTVVAPRLDQYHALGQTPPSLHSALFYPDAEPTLETGVVAMTSAALTLLR
jgi:hippurate hydrolase